MYLLIILFAIRGHDFTRNDTRPLVTHQAGLLAGGVVSIGGAVECGAKLLQRQVGFGCQQSRRNIGGKLPVVVVVLPAQVQPTFCTQRTADQAEIKAWVGVAMVAGRIFRAPVGAAGEQAVDHVIGISSKHQQVFGVPACVVLVIAGVPKNLPRHGQRIRGHGLAPRGLVGLNESLMLAGKFKDGGAVRVVVAQGHGVVNRLVKAEPAVPDPCPSAVFGMGHVNHAIR